MRRRLTACLLLAVFLGAGTSLPGADALLHHWSGAPADELRAHVEPAGGCTGHADECTLGRAAAGAGAIVPVVPVIRVWDAGQPDARLAPSSPFIAAYRGAIAHSRAPPAARS